MRGHIRRAEVQAVAMAALRAVAAAGADGCAVLVQANAPAMVAAVMKRHDGADADALQADGCATLAAVVASGDAGSAAVSQAADGVEVLVGALLRRGVADADAGTDGRKALAQLVEATPRCGSGWSARTGRSFWVV